MTKVKNWNTITAQSEIVSSIFRINSVKFLFNTLRKQVQFNNNSTLSESTNLDSNRVIFIFIARDFYHKISKCLETIRGLALEL